MTRRLGTSPTTGPGPDWSLLHNPFVYFHPLRDLGSCATDDVSLDQLPRGLSRRVRRARSRICSANSGTTPMPSRSHARRLHPATHQIWRIGASSRSCSTGPSARKPAFHLRRARAAACCATDPQSRFCDVSRPRPAAPRVSPVARRSPAVGGLPWIREWPVSRVRPAPPALRVSCRLRSRTSIEASGFARPRDPKEFRGGARSDGGHAIPVDQDPANREEGATGTSISTTSR